MTPAAAIAVLRAHREALRALGVARAAVFGSVARGEARAGSDLDVLVEIDPAAALDLYAYVGVVQFIAGLFDGPVDVTDRATLHPRVRPFAEREAMYAF